VSCPSVNCGLSRILYKASITIIGPYLIVLGFLVIVELRIVNYKRHALIFVFIIIY
jgi:hypothetical protein